MADPSPCETRYPYAESDGFKERQSYSYTPFEGIGFFRAWADSRDQFQTCLSDPEPAPPPVSSGSRTKWPWDTLLEFLYHALTAETSQSPEACRLLDGVLKNFEVSRRIYAFYDEKLKPLDRSGYQEIERYVRLAEIFDAAYVALSDIRYLNGLLKCLDLVASEPKIPGAAAGRLSRLINQERVHISNLAVRNGIDTSWN